MREVHCVSLISIIMKIKRKKSLKRITNENEYKYWHRTVMEKIISRMFSMFLQHHSRVWYQIKVKVRTLQLHSLLCFYLMSENVRTIKQVAQWVTIAYLGASIMFGDIII